MFSQADLQQFDYSEAVTKRSSLTYRTPPVAASDYYSYKK